MTVPEMVRAYRSAVDEVLAEGVDSIEVGDIVEKYVDLGIRQEQQKIGAADCDGELGHVMVQCIYAGFALGIATGQQLGPGVFAAGHEDEGA